MSFINRLRSIVKGIGVTVAVIFFLAYIVLLVLAACAFPFLAIGFLIAGIAERSILLTLVGIWGSVIAFIMILMWFVPDPPEKKPGATGADGAAREDQSATKAEQNSKHKDN